MPKTSSGGVMPSAASCVGGSQVEPKAGEGDHHRQHPILRAGDAPVVLPVDEGAVVSEGESENFKPSQIIHDLPRLLEE